LWHAIKKKKGWRWIAVPHPRSFAKCAKRTGHPESDSSATSKAKATRLDW